MDGFDPANVTAAVLAGGAGSRLGGRDKGLHLLVGIPLIAHVSQALSAQVGTILLCINRNPEAYAAYGATCVDKVTGFRGPLAGIASALDACRTQWLLTVPVDCPCPPADLARRLHAAALPGAAAVAHDGVRREPLFALYSRRVAAEARAALQRDLPVWRWQDEIGAIEVDFAPSAGAFVNLNTAEEFRAWETGRHG